MATTQHPHHEGRQPVETDVLDGASHDYPSDLRYVYVALFLAGVTVLEVTTYTHADLWEPVLVPALLGMMAIKFWCVAWYFMHLRYDKKLLTWSFYSGVALALLVYLAVLMAFNFF